MDKEYIEREKARELIDNYGKNAVDLGRWSLDPVDDIIALAKGVDKIPSADVVEVVRCKDCKYTDVHICPITGKETLFCEFGRRGIKPEAVNPTHFCGYGERKDK